MENKSCFVITGYGKKTSYIDGKVRVLDLDETYELLIKPVFDDLGIECYRAIDKNVNGSIDKLMLQEIKDADIALADISTLNANVMWELGVRHALKPRHTIMICETEQMKHSPFDINHFVIHQYTHSEQGIPFKEVKRFKDHLTLAVQNMLKQQPPAINSPYFTFLGSELEQVMEETKKNVEASKTGKGNEKNEISQNSNDETFASLLNNAEKAKNNKEFEKALEYLRIAYDIANQNMSLKDNLTFIICRQALCTYKSEKPNKLEAFINANKILEELNPAQSMDVEVLGLSGAINKRLYELNNNTTYLDNSIQSYERGFMLRQDYYNGINAAFMLYKKASIAKKINGEWVDIKLKADYIRNSVLEIATKLEAGADFINTPDAIWVLYTLAEAYNYKKNEAKQKEYEEKADELASKLNDKFAPSAYSDQKEKIKEIFKNLN